MRAHSFAAIALTLLAAGSSPSQTAETRPIALFNGKDLSGWTHYLWDSESKTEDKTTPMSAVWSVENGVLVCKGKPIGYLRTEKEYENYRLSLEWLWPEGTPRGSNNGVLVHTTTPNALGAWPKSFEVQLQLASAGVILVIGTTLEIPDPERKPRGRSYRRLNDTAEKPAGEWNKMEILCKGDEITVHVNGELVNHVIKASQTKGAISLQSEGRLIHYRNIYLTPLGD